MSNDKMPYTSAHKQIDCTKTGCYGKRARYFIECKNNWTSTTYTGQACEDCLLGAIENDYKITGYIIYPNVVEQFLTQRKTNADFGHPTGIWDMKGMLEELEEIAK